MILLTHSTASNGMQGIIKFIGGACVVIALILLLAAFAETGGGYGSNPAPLFAAGGSGLVSGILLLGFGKVLEHLSAIREHLGESAEEDSSPAAD